MCQVFVNKIETNQKQVRDKLETGQRQVRDTLETSQRQARDKLDTSQRQFRKRYLKIKVMMDTEPFIEAIPLR